MDPSAPPSDGACHFFRLPAELRAVIYTIALREPEGVRCRNVGDANQPLLRFFPADTSAEQSELESALEVNQLKYVCRATREEVAGVVLHNELVFDFGNPEIFDILQALPRVKHSHKRLIMVKYPDAMAFRVLPRESYWHDIIRFMQQHVDHTLSLQLTQPSLSRCDHLIQLVMFAECMHGTFAYTGRFMAVRKDSWRIPHLQHFMLRNLHFYEHAFRMPPLPHPQTIRFQFRNVNFDEDIFRKGVRWCHSTRSEAIEDMVKWVKEILEKGL